MVTSVWSFSSGKVSGQDKFPVRPTSKKKGCGFAGRASFASVVPVDREVRECEMRRLQDE